MANKDIFIVEDDLFFAQIFTKKIQNFGDFKVHHFQNCETALNELLKIKPSAIFLDHYLAGLNGIDALPMFKENLPETKIVIISSQTDIAVLDKAMKNGATNYFKKDVLIMKNTEQFLGGLNHHESTLKKFFNSLIGY